MDKMKYTLVEVVAGDKRVEREFIDLPKRIYRDNPYWVCPFDSSIKAVFDPKKNSHRHRRTSQDSQGQPSRGCYP